jgi:uncharacterized protein YndB with AHSA1/START domain
MVAQETFSGQVFNASTLIKASEGQVWAALTTPDLMKQWMLPEEKIEILTDSKRGAPFIIRGNMHGISFENFGVVLKFEQGKEFSYSHLSSLSGLADEPGNYTVITFRLSWEVNQTKLSLHVHNFPTEAIYRHIVFYWSTTLELLNKFIVQLQ